MFNIQELYKETGIDNIWKNYSDLKWIAVQLQKQSMYMLCKYKVYIKLKQHKNNKK